MRIGGNREKLAFTGVLVLIAVLVGGALIVNALWDRPPDEDSAEAGFLRDMQVHHNQAVVMAMIIRDRTDDDQLKAIATDIAFTQTSQIGTMAGFLNLWELNPTGDDMPMAWMGHPTEGRMRGMASPEEVDLLRTLPVDQAEVLFLQLMNRHHVAGVEMAQAIIERSDQEDLVEMAESMVRVQNAEIEVMNQFLEERGAEPVTTSDAVIEVQGSASPAATPAGHHSGH